MLLILLLRAASSINSGVVRENGAPNATVDVIFNVMFIFSKSMAFMFHYSTGIQISAQSGKRKYLNGDGVSYMCTLGLQVPSVYPIICRILSEAKQYIYIKRTSPISQKSIAFLTKQLIY